MSGNRDLVKELVDLYEKNVNERKRKEILDAMLAHPCGHTLAEVIFRRAHPSVFISARNQTMYDSLLAPAHCKSILRTLGSEDYVVNFLRDEFNHKFGKDPCCLSDIAQIMDERHQIQKETAIPKFEVTIPLRWFDDHPTPRVDEFKIKMGSEWIVNYRMTTYSVYKINRWFTNGILLEQMSRFLDASSSSSGFFLLEPFLIMKSRMFHCPSHLHSIKVHNLLEQNAAPIAIEREGLIDMDGWRDQYESDKRENGKLPESLLFLLVHQTNTKEICVECIKIRASSIETVWTKVIFSPYHIQEPNRNTTVVFINQDNYVIETYISVTDGYISKKIYHVVLSKAKMTEYILAEKFYKFRWARYGIFEETLVQIGVYQQGDIKKKVFGVFNSEELCCFDPVCFFNEINGYDVHGYEIHGYDIQFLNQEILIRDRNTEMHVTELNKNEKRVSIRKLIDFINDEDEEKIFVDEELFLRAPIISLWEFAEQHGVQEEEVLDRSKIGRVLMKKKKIQIFI